MRRDAGAARDRPRRCGASRKPVRRRCYTLLRSRPQMAKISDILSRGRSFSFEFFPPRTEKAEETLRQALVELEPLGPSYVSVTYGAGGSTRDRTHDIVVDILRNTSMTPMAHLTCCAHTRAELVEVVERYREAGIENILALGGDPPADLDLPEGELQ